ncbi:O-antigen ligase family protein [Enterobacter pasteurii]
MNLTLNDFLYKLSGALLFLSLILPTSLSLIKFALLLSILLLYFIKTGGFLTIAKQNVLLTVLFTIVGAVWVLYGALRGNPGAVSMSTVLIIYPVLFGILSGLYREQLNEKLYKLFVYAAWVLSLIILLILIDYLWIHVGIYNIATLIYDKDSVVIDNSGGYFKFTVPNISSLIFLIPFLISAIFFRKTPARYYVLFVILCVIAILSGRRALLLTMFMAPMISVLLTSDKRSNNKYFSRLLIAALLACVAIYVFYMVYPDYFIDRVANIFNFDSNESNLERKYQFDALMAGFFEHPLIGNGAGAAASYLRSDTQPWAYELSYVAFLFQFGILGFFIYLSGVLYLFFTLIKRVKLVGRNSFEFCYLSGFISFMIANATNPYLLKFDYMWVIFIPLGLSNLFFTKNAYVVNNCDTRNSVLTKTDVK